MIDSQKNAFSPHPRRTHGWFVPGVLGLVWAAMLLLDAAIGIISFNAADSLGGSCGCGFSLANGILKTAAPVLAGLAAVQIVLHRVWAAPFWNRAAWQTRLPLVIGGALFTGHFVAIPGIIHSIIVLAGHG